MVGHTQTQRLHVEVFSPVIEEGKGLKMLNIKPAIKIPMSDLEVNGRMIVRWVLRK
jgi:hypothetical protein